MLKLFIYVLGLAYQTEQAVRLKVTYCEIKVGARCLLLVAFIVNSNFLIQWLASLLVFVPPLEHSPLADLDPSTVHI